ncbi:MAG TPA: hypothetical protein VKV03_02805 [Candidatus Binataceae bacterium]|nr:hypothetical protein [Candidatus Binataceae bacterium]
MAASSVQKITAPVGPARTPRRTLPQMTPIALGCGVIVIIARMLTTGIEQRVGVYLSGIITAILFVGVGLYSVRKRNLWFSLRMLNLARRVFPKSVFGTVVFLDRLETWRATHVVVAMLSLLPFWWHMQRHLMGPLEAALATAVALLFISGLFGVLIQDRLPHYMTRFAEHEVRTQDVNAKINAVYVEAEEKILGHTEAFTQDYLKRIKPVLLEDRSSWSLFGATIARRDIGNEVNLALSANNPYSDADANAWNDLTELATRKVNLEQNDFNLWLSTSWLRFHVIVAVLTFALLGFHILSVLYYGGA